METLQCIGSVAELNNSLAILAEKLPFRLHESWNRRFAKISYRDQRTSNFTDLVTFVEEEANFLNAYPEQLPSVRLSDNKPQAVKTSTKKLLMLRLRLKKR